MKVSQIRHTGITVRNLEKSVAFYRDVLGMKDVGRAERRDEFISRVVGIPNTYLKMAFLSMGPVTLELLEYVTPNGRPAGVSRPNDVGNLHVAFEVDDIEQAYRELKVKGAKFADKPQYVPDGQGKGTGAIYLWDPDGINLELLQSPKG